MSTRQSRLIYDRCLKYESEHDKYRCNPYRIKLKTLLIVENIDINYLMDMVINEEKVNKNVIPKTE